MLSFGVGGQSQLTVLRSCHKHLGGVGEVMREVTVFAAAAMGRNRLIARFKLSRSFVQSSISEASSCLKRVVVLDVGEKRIGNYLISR
jgi:hypothetical protein